MFGAPVAHEDDSERAVRAGLAIQRALAAYAEDVAEAYDIDLRCADRRQHRPGGDHARRRGLRPLQRARRHRQRHRPAAGAGRRGRRDARPRDRSARCATASSSSSSGEIELRGRDAGRSTASASSASATAAPRPRRRPAGRPRRRARRRSAPPCERAGRGHRRDRLGHRRAGHRQVAPGGRGGRAGARPAAPARRPRLLLHRELPVLADARPPARLARASATSSEARVRLDLKAALHELYGADGDERYPFLASLLGLQETDRRAAADAARAQPRVAAPAQPRGRGRPVCVAWPPSGRCWSCSRTCTGPTS